MVRFVFSVSLSVFSEPSEASSEFPIVFPNRGLNLGSTLMESRWYWGSIGIQEGISFVHGGEDVKWFVLFSVPDHCPLKIWLGTVVIILSILWCNKKYKRSQSGLKQ
jgi:hypothetical protein